MLGGPADLPFWLVIRLEKILSAVNLGLIRFTS